MPDPRILSDEKLAKIREAREKCTHADERLLQMAVKMAEHIAALTERRQRVAELVEGMEHEAKCASRIVQSCESDGMWYASKSLPCDCIVSRLKGAQNG